MAHILIVVLIASFLPFPALGAAPPETAEIPTGTLLSVELVDGVSSSKSVPGDTFRARVLDGVTSKGRVAVPPGTTVRGLVVEAVKSGRLHGQAHLALALSSLELDGSTFSVTTDTLAYMGDPHAGKNLGSVLGGALQGAVMGVLFGGQEGAILGAGAGAGAGALGTIIKGKQDIAFEPGARLLFETRGSFTVQVYATPAPLPSLPAIEKPAVAAPPAGKPST